jgi:hypothetical protein
MKFFFGLIVGVIVACIIGAAAVAVAFGNLGDLGVGDRDKSKDISQTFDLRDFDRIDIAGVYELEVTVGGDFSVEVSGPEDEMERVEASVEGGELVLDQRERRRGEKRWRDHEGLTARISLPALSAIEASGVVDGDVTGVAAETFKVDISGVGDMDLAGECGDLDAQVSGVGDLNAEDLKCKNVVVDVSGVGSASVFASESVEATVSGMGDINVSGSPKSVEKNGGMFSSISVD